MTYSYLTLDKSFINEPFSTSFVFVINFGWLKLFAMASISFISCLYKEYKVLNK